MFSRRFIPCTRLASQDIVVGCHVFRFVQRRYREIGTHRTWRDEIESDGTRCLSVIIVHLRSILCISSYRSSRKLDSRIIRNFSGKGEQMKTHPRSRRLTIYSLLLILAKDRETKSMCGSLSCIDNGLLTNLLRPNQIYCQEDQTEYD